MNDLFNLLAAWLADVLLLGSALLLLAHAAGWFIRQPAWRMSLAWGTLLGLLLLAIITACPLWPRQSLLPRRAAVDSESSSLPPIIIGSDAILSHPPSNESADLLAPAALAPVARAERSGDTLANRLSPSTAQQQAIESPLVAHLVRFWLCGAALALGWIVLGAWQAARLLRRSQESPAWSRLELAQLVAKRRCEPRLRVSERIATAVALGTRRPHILLPAQSVQPENVAGVRAALAHEWAHIRHGDLWLLALERLLLPLFFWHPLFWLFRRRVRFDQELLADSAAAGEQPLEYAEALVAWAKSAVSSPSQPPLGMAALSLWENPRSLTRRVEMILQAKHPLLPTASRPWRWLVLTSLLAVVLGLSLVTLRPTAVAQEESFLADYAKVKKEAASKKKKQKKARDEADRQEIQARVDKASSAAVTMAEEIAIELDLLILELNQEKLEKSEIDLGEFLQESSRQCRLEDDLIIADCSREQVQSLLQRFRMEKAVEVLSRPKIRTLSDQVARVQVAGATPVREFDETVNGKTVSRVEVEHRTNAIELAIKPHLHPGHKVELKITLDGARLLPSIANSLPVVKKQTMQLDTEVLLGETVVIAERASSPKKGKAPQGTLLLVITPQQVAGATPRSAQRGFIAQGAQAQGQAVEEQGEQVREAVRRGMAWLAKHQAADEVRAIEQAPQEGAIKLLVQSLQQHDAQKLAEELQQAVQALRLRRLEMEAANYRDGVEMLHRENDELRAQVNQLQKKLIDMQVRLAWLRNAAAPEGSEKVSDEVFLRRAYLDLLGLLPNPEEMQAFLQMEEPAKRTKLIDQLLASPQYRELTTQAWLNALQKTKVPAPAAVAPSPAANPPGEPATPILPPATSTLPPTGLPEPGANFAPNAATSGESQDIQKLQQRLYALDIREAEISLRAARADFERSQALAKSGNAPISRQELFAAAAAVEKAEVSLELVKARGDRRKTRQLEVRLAEGLLRAAKANLELMSQLVKAGAITASELDAARFEVEKAEVSLERNQALEALKP